MVVQAEPARDPYVQGALLSAHLALIIPFIQLGQWIYREPPLRITIGIIRTRVAEDAWGFFHDFGWVILRAPPHSSWSRRW